MHAYLFRSSLCILSIALIVGTAFVSSEAYEIHIVGDAAYKCVDGVWTQTLEERMGSMTAIWAFSENDIFVGDMDGIVRHYDGYSWNTIYEDTAPRDILSMWGTSSSNLYICCGDVFLHFDGNTCTEIFGPGENDDYEGVYGFSEDDIYMVAYDWTLKNRLYHNSSGNPLAWELVDLPSGIANQDMNFTAVWGSSGDDLFVTSRTGDIIHWNGMNWQEIDSGVSYVIRDIWGSSGTDVFAVTNSSIVHYDGDTCTVMSHPTISSLRWVIGDSSSNVLTGGLGDDVLHYNGSEWVALPGDEVDFGEDAFMFSSDHALIVAWEGMMYCYNGSSIERCDQEYFPVRPLNAVSGTGTGNVYAVANEGYVYMYDGSSWSEMARPTTSYLLDIIAFADDDICVGGTVVTLHYDGVSWELMGGDETVGGSIWGFSSDDLYAVRGGSVYHYDGTDWTQVFYQANTSDVSYYLLSIWGSSADDIYAVGYCRIYDDYSGYPIKYECPIIVHYDGIEWAFQSTGYPCPTGYPPINDDILRAIWGSSAIDIWTGGDLDIVDPVLIHNNGIEWDPVTAPFSNCEAIWGSSTGAYAYFLDGDDGDVYLYTNLEWTSWDVTHAYMRDMWGIGEAGSNVIVTVESDPEGRKISVDGSVYYDTFRFGAEPGTIIEIKTESPQVTIGGAEYHFIEWSDGGDIVHDIVVPDTNVTYTAYFYGIAEVTVMTEPEGFEFTVLGSTYSTPYITTMICGDEFEIGTISPQRDKGTDYYFAEWSDGGDIVHTATMPFRDAVFTATFTDIITGDEVEPVPLVNALHQNHPNPFNPSTTITFSLRERGAVSLAIYDVAGRLVRVLIDDVMEAGPRDVTWDGRDNAGRGAASGVYFYRLEAGEFVETRKMVLLR